MCSVQGLDNDKAEEYSEANRDCKSSSIVRLAHFDDIGIDILEDMQVSSVEFSAMKLETNQSLDNRAPVMRERIDGVGQGLELLGNSEDGGTDVPPLRAQGTGHESAHERGDDTELGGDEHGVRG